MKKKVNIFLLAGILISWATLNGQVTRLGAGSSADAGYIVTVNGSSVRVVNLYTLDSLKVPHFASFDIEVVSDGDTKKVLEALFSAAAGKQAIKLSIATVNYQNQISDQRNYNGAMVTEIDVPELSGSSKDIVKMKVKILSPDMNGTSEKGQLPGKLSQQGKRAMAGNFKLTMGSLPVQKVSGISNLKTSSFLNTGYFNFNIEVARVDADQWKKWFDSGAGGGKREEGTITLADASFSDVAYLQISEIEIVAVSETSNSGDAIAKTTIGLRAKRLNFSMK